MNYRRSHRIPDYTGMVRSWPKRQRIAVSENPVRPAVKWGILAGAAALTVLAVILIRKPAIAGATMAISKIKASELVKKWFSTPVTQIPAAEAPPSLVKIYPLANADTRTVLETTPFGDLAAWTSSGYYNFPADTAQVNSVQRIAETPAEFVSKTKQAAIAAAAKAGIKDPRFIVAQAAHEGGWGKSAIGGTNIFGHVASESWTQKAGNTYSYERTWESIKKDGVATKIRTVRPFRVYPSLESAFDAHVAIIKQWPSAISADTIEKYATALVSGKTKYATDPDYVDKLKGAYNTVSQYWS